MGIYFSKSAIFNEMMRYTKMIGDHYQVGPVELYIEVEENNRVSYLGHSFEFNNKRFVLKMAYIEDGQGRIAIRDKRWLLSIDDTIIGIYDSIGGVFKDNITK